MTNEQSSQSFPFLGWFAAAFVIVLLLKFSLAALLDLYSDEIFYWWAGTKLSLAYSDLPFMTALLAGLGSGFGPSDSFSVRLFFLLLGTAIPFVVYWVAKPISNQRMALESAALTLCLPLGGFLGLLAVPDVPLIFFGLLAIGFFQRALSGDQIPMWIATGCFVALGLSTHYRFFLYPLAAVLFLILFREQRKQWTSWKFWLAVGIASLGLIPILWFNLSNQLSSASFYLVERHPWEFQATGLLHLFKQAGLVTPPLYILFIVTIVMLYRDAKNSNQDSALLFAFASTNLLVYLILAPWTDANSTSIHWPLSGYFPLLVALPIALRRFHTWATQRWNERQASHAVTAIPLIGFLGTLVAFIGVGSQAFQLQLQPLVGTGVLSNKMAGWQEFSSHTQQLLRENFDDVEPVFITDNYYTAAQLEFASITSKTLTIDRDKAVRDGRITQINLWNKGVTGIDEFAGQPALYINEDSSLVVDDKTDLMKDMCAIVSEISHLDTLSLFNGDKAFSFYSASQINAIQSDRKSTAFPCPYPAQAWIDYPAANDVLAGTIDVSGWAYNEDIGIERVQLLIDKQVIGTPSYGSNRQDVVDIRNVSTDPNAPNLGYSIQLDTLELPNGVYELAIELYNKAGVREVYGKRRIAIAN